MKPVAIYARVSTADQNPEAQLSELRDYAAQRKFQIHREYIDRITGAVEKRKRSTAYDELLADAKRHRFGCVLVWKFDRFARSLPALLHSLETFNTLGIDFISITQQFDTTMPMGRLMFSIVGAFAEFEREMIRERVIAGIENAKRKGVQLGRPREIDSAAIEARIGQLRKEGLGVRAIGRAVARSAAHVSRILKRGKV